LPINFKGIFWDLKKAAARLDDNAQVINFFWSVTRLILPSYGLYSRTKAGVYLLTGVLAKEVGARGITVNFFSPQYTNTDLFLEGKVV
jgi:3-oxoacyl-[acyl-carrier protein] reductase